MKLRGLPPRPFHAEEVDGGAFAGILAALFADFSHTGDHVGDIVEKLVGVAEIDAPRQRQQERASDGRCQAQRSPRRGQHRCPEP
ncbi:MAG: hypothetical protein WBB72_03520 [Methyloceanibacter sp.]